MIYAPQEWLTTAEVAEILGRSERHVRNLLTKVDSGLVRHQQQGRGRPRKQYHYTAHTELYAWFEAQRRATFEPDQNAPETPVEDLFHKASDDVIHPLDLATARLRQKAVMEYRARRLDLTEAEAAAATVADWQRNPRRETVTVSERNGHRVYNKDHAVTVGGFRESTLRGWNAAHKKGGLLALAPAKRKSGRPKKRVPEKLVDLIYAEATKSERADIAKGIAKAKELWRGDWPQVSDETLLRRVRALDPAKFAEDLHKHGLAKMRSNHLPDIERDYSLLSFNEEWQLDDVDQDFYGFAASDQSLIRPYVYAIIRLSTRQWVAAVASETKITQDQVRSLLGIAMASPSGGVPDRITFEGGTIACDEYLKDLLGDLGVKVHITGQHTGCIYPGAYADASLGHSQGKAVNEANNRRLHNLLYDQPGQVGGEERHTKARRKETMFAAARKAAKDGEFIIFPTAPEWQQIIIDAVEKHNNTPHSGLPQIVCPRTGERRHMTPNERALQLKAATARVMDSRLLPAFFERGLKVKVTRNGFKLNNEWFGRFDEDLDPYRGRHVMAYAHPEIPGVAYVMELARCVDAYRKAGRNHGQQFAGKKGREKRYRNEFNRIIETALEEGSNLILDRTHVTADPVPERDRETIAPEALLTRAETQRTANDARREQRTGDRARFDIDADTESAPRRRGVSPRSSTRSLSKQAASAREQVGALQHNAEEPDPFEL